jgi:hypothetical protein
MKNWRGSFGDPQSETGCIITTKLDIPDVSAVNRDQPFEFEV